MLPTDYTRGAGQHYQGDCLDLLGPDNDWDLLICHPPCTYLTNAAEWAYKDPDFIRFPGVGYHQKVKPETLTGAHRREARKQAIKFFGALWTARVGRIAVENPVGCIGGSTQRIQPYQFREDAKKTTCLWLKNLPPLTPTKYVAPRMVDGKPRWGNQTDSGQNRVSPGEDRWAERSLTPWGVAWAMAEQWGELEW